MSIARAEQRFKGEVECSGPFKFLNPTTRKCTFELQKKERENVEDNENGSSGTEAENGSKKIEDDPESKDEVGASDVQRLYRTRDNRKGRHAITITPTADKNPRYLTPPPTGTLKATLHGIYRMFTSYPVWDVSYLVATIFTLGSVVWVINAFFVWLPLEDPSSEFSGEITSGGGITAFIGATIFVLGSILLMIEAVNENRSECFGWAIEEVLESGGRTWRVREDKDECSHHHGNKKNLIGRGKARADKPPLDVEMAGKNHPNSSNARTWTWWPTWYEMKTHYLKEVGFLACLSQMIGATIFWISGFTALPPIYDRLTSTAAQNGAYWLPQVIGGTGFIVSGTLFMLETQQKWYLPAPKVLGWHIGVWNLIGGVGFTLCGALGFGAQNSGCVYQGSLATFWGSWCFLIGSVVQWYESLDKSPVDVVDNTDVEEGGGRIGGGKSED